MNPQLLHLLMGWTNQKIKCKFGLSLAEERVE